MARLAIEDFITERIAPESATESATESAVAGVSTEGVITEIRSSFARESFFGAKAARAFSSEFYFSAGAWGL